MFVAFYIHTYIILSTCIKHVLLHIIYTSHIYDAKNIYEVFKNGTKITHLHCTLTTLIDQYLTREEVQFLVKLKKKYTKKIPINIIMYI